MVTVGLRKSRRAIIIGAGPAGCAAAIRCRSAGIDAVVIEHAGMPRHRPGETLHPAIEPLLEALGVGSVLEDAPHRREAGIWVDTGYGASFSPYGCDTRGEWRGYQILREDLDTALVARAIQSGASIVNDTVVSALSDAGRVVGVRTLSRVFEGDVVIDASGQRNILSRSLNLSRVTISPRLIARYGYCKIGPKQDIQPSALFAFEPEGWNWTARVSGTRYHWTRLNWSGDKNLDRPKLLSALDPCGPTRGADVTWRYVSAPAGPGYFIVGDAAVTIDPASSHGILRAILSGIFSAHLAHSVVLGGPSESEAAAMYSRWLKDWVDNDIKNLKQLYRKSRWAPRWASD